MRYSVVRSLKLALGILLLWLLLTPTTYAADSVFGRWQTIDDQTNKAKSIVEIYQQNDKLYGKIIRLFRAADEDPDPVCSQCTDDRKGQKIIGMVIIDGLVADGDTWSGGQILDPANGKTYKVKLWLDQDKLQVRGYVGIFFRTQVWLPADN